VILSQIPRRLWHFYQIFLKISLEMKELKRVLKTSRAKLYIISIERENKIWMTKIITRKKENFRR
jgi:hypothetical protein